jgi:hypothetical protein
MAEGASSDAAMMVAATKSAAPKAAVAKSKKWPWRAWLRAVHRDSGYLAVGLTFIYALSGLAVNHLTDWSDGDASFRNYTRTVQLGGPISGDDDAIKSKVVRRLGIKTEARDVFRRSEEEIDISFDKRTVHLNTRTGEAVDEGQEPRFLLRVANWLHLNRGKKAWTYVADTYAVALLFLATSGMFMLAGKKGLLGRGALFVSIGIAIPILYVQLSGGP